MSFLLKKYDTLIAFAVLLGVAASAFYLWTGFQARDNEARELTRRIDAMDGAPHAVAQAADLLPYETAAQRLGHPPRLSLPEKETPGFFTPDVRVWCPRCFKPIPEKSVKCPACGADLKDKETPDDYPIYGPDCPITFGWVKKHNLDFTDPAEADRDHDNDGFTALEEFLAGTDPRDPKSHPPFETKLALISVTSTPVGLVFTSKSDMGEGIYWCNISDGKRTYITRITDDETKRGSGDADLLKNKGYKAVSLEVLSKKDKPPNEWRDIDISKLTLLRVKDGVNVILTLNQDDATEVFAELGVTLSTIPPPEPSNITTGSAFTLGETEFRVIEINNQEQTVVVENKATGKRLTVKK